MKQFQDSTPTNIDLLCDEVEDRLSWRRRLEAVEELGKWRCNQSIHALYKRIAHDLAFPVKELAFRKLQAFGEDVRLTKNKRGNLVPKIEKKFQLVRQRMINPHSYDEFKALVKELYPEAYDLYECQKGARFDEWLQKWINTSS